MGVQLMDNAAALRMFFTDDVYFVGGDEVADAASATQEPAVPGISSTMPAAQNGVNVAVSVPISVAVPMPVAEVPAVLNTPVEALPVLPVPESKSHEFKYVGKNQKCVLILVNDAENPVSTERGRALLRNIVKAIQLSASDFALVNYSGYKSAKFSDLSAFFTCRLVLAFGVAPTELGLMEYPQNKLVVEEHVQMVFSADLDVLAADQNGKKTLWGSLKQLSI